MAWPVRVWMVLLGLMLGADARAEPSLFDALGGMDGVTQIIEATFTHVLADDRIKRTFDESNVTRVKAKLVEQICMIADGPCRYTGHDMKAAHRGLHLTVADFNALVEDLQDGMDDRHVPYWTQNRLLARLAPMVHDVVTR